MYTVLVLDFCKGGELFDFLQESYSQITEGLARRIVSELSDAVSWLHSVGLVHRDIKLESKLQKTPKNSFSQICRERRKLTLFRSP